MSSVIALFKFILFGLLCVLVVPPQLLVLFLHQGKYAYIIPSLFHKAVCCIFRIRVAVENQTPPLQSQCIFVSNHISYLDIPVIGSVLLSKATFVAKQDVSGWPVFGFLSKLQQTIFISRERDKAPEGKSSVDKALREGKGLILFPEGTSTDGQTVFPFKSSLFSIFLNQNQHDIPIQPVTLSVVSVDGHSVITQEDRDIYSWHINMDLPLGPHLWRFAKGSGAVVRLFFHDPISASLYPDRKSLAKACQEAVSNGLMEQNIKMHQTI